MFITKRLTPARIQKSARKENRFFCLRAQEWVIGRCIHPECAEVAPILDPRERAMLDHIRFRDGSPLSSTYLERHTSTVAELIRLNLVCLVRGRVYITSAGERT